MCSSCERQWVTCMICSFYNTAWLIAVSIKTYDEPLRQLISRGARFLQNDVIFGWLMSSLLRDYANLISTWTARITQVGTLPVALKTQI
jgi:hypothetical protein